MQAFKEVLQERVEKQNISNSIRLGESERIATTTTIRRDLFGNRFWLIQDPRRKKPSVNQSWNLHNPASRFD